MASNRGERHLVCEFRIIIYFKKVPPIQATKAPRVGRGIALPPFF